MELEEIKKLTKEAYGDAVQVRARLSGGRLKVRNYQDYIAITFRPKETDYVLGLLSDINPLKALFLHAREFWRDLISRF